VLASGRRTRHGDESEASILGYIGVAELALGDPESARRAFEESLTIRLSIARVDPANANALPFTALSHAELARVYEVLGDDPLAIEHVHAATGIFAENPARTELLPLVAESLLRQARLERRAGRGRAACSALSQARTTFQQVAATGRLSPRRQKWWDEAEGLYATCPGATPAVRTTEVVRTIAAPRPIAPSR
jgi:hypothetical protein